ncbi:kallikrein-4-like [Cimex lectularius]|uniref:Peptidase S1 domain-containing protein n=1 Tax=Cimex lectularius TaxID=79782 RepID=A0A8I6RC32_CIMLE|nr:kallikrein-4-like [Cimex lectularius]
MRWAIVVLCISSVSAVKRITGSGPSVAESASFTAFLMDEDSRWCTGGVIDPYWILTSAYCALRKKLLIVLGARNMSNLLLEIGSNESFMRTPEYVVVHPKYSPKFDQYDIALVKLYHKIEDKRVQPVPLGSSWPSASNEMTVCQVAGYGGDPTQSMDPGILRSAYVYAMHGPYACRCLSKHASRRSICLNDSRVQPCSSDWGHLLVCNGSAYGVVHTSAWLHTCDLTQFTAKRKIKVACGHPDVTTVYTFICPVLGWIRSHVGSAPEQPASCTATTIYPFFYFIASLLTVWNAD